MHAKKREIIGLFLTAFVLLTAVGIVLHKLQEKKQTNETDLYSLMASSPHAVISIHHPARFTNEILASEAARKLFASFIPPVFLSVMPHIHAPLLLSFHQQGAVLYVQADAASAKQLEKTAAQSFDAFAPATAAKRRPHNSPSIPTPATVFSAAIITTTSGWPVSAKSSWKRSPKTKRKEKQADYWRPPPSSAAHWTLTFR